MGKYISCGRINKYYGYIFLSIFFMNLQDFILGVNYNNSFQNINIPDFSGVHNIIHDLFGFILTFFSSLIIYKCKIKKHKSILINETESVQKQKEEEHSKKHLIKLLLIIILWVIQEQLIQIYIDTLKNLDFWMLQLIIMYYFMKKTFNVKLFQHQILSFILIIFPFIFKIITIVLTCISHDKNDPGIIYIDNKILIPIGILLYIILLISNSYIVTQIKMFMDIRFISIPEILMYFGLFGSIICLIITFSSTYVECYQLFEGNICDIRKKGKNNEDIYYLENYKIYFNELKKNLINEIIFNLFYTFSFLFQYFFSLQIIKFLSPIHNIFCYPLGFFFQKIILAIITLCKENKLFVDNEIKFIYWKFILDIVGELTFIISLMIYLEIIELNFCNLNYNTRESILIRAKDDSVSDSSEKDFLFLQNGDIEEISIGSKKSDKKNKSIEFKINN